MLPKNKSISRGDFLQILKKNRSFYSKDIKLVILDNVNKNKTTKFSFVVSRKVSNRAVDRNLIKRRLKCIVLSFDKYIKNGSICVFFVKKSILYISFNELKNEIYNLLKKAGIIL